MVCEQSFGMFLWRTHCRSCGYLVCSSCTPGTLQLDRYVDEKVGSGLQYNPNFYFGNRGSDHKVCLPCQRYAPAEIAAREEEWRTRSSRPEQKTQRV